MAHDSDGIADDSDGVTAADAHDRAGTARPKPPGPRSSSSESHQLLKPRRVALAAAADSDTRGSGRAGRPASAPGPGSGRASDGHVGHVRVGTRDRRRLAPRGFGPGRVRVHGAEAVRRGPTPPARRRRPG